MLGYLLWHWPLAEVDAAAYEASISGFHRALADLQPKGFLGSASFRVSGAPWAASCGPAYEDWYLLEDSAAIDVLNDLAVSGESKGHHDSAALALENAAAGLYTLRVGNATVASLKEATQGNWLAKPKGQSYEDFFAFIEPWTREGNVPVWRRQMVLGPTLEFCLISGRNLELPSNLTAVQYHIERHC